MRLLKKDYKYNILSCVTHTHTHARTHTAPRLRQCESNAVQSCESLCSWFHAWFAHSLSLAGISALLTAFTPAKSTEPHRIRVSSLSSTIVPSNISPPPSAHAKELCLFVCLRLAPSYCKHLSNLPRSALEWILILALCIWFIALLLNDPISEDSNMSVLNDFPAGVERLIPPCTDNHAAGSSTNLKIDSAPLVRGLSTVLFSNLLPLKWHISRAPPLLRSPSSTRTGQILWQLREGGKRERERERRRQTRRKGRAGSESLERGCRCSTAPSHRLHANEEIPLQPQQQPRRRWSGAAGGGPEPTLYRRSPW